MARKGKVKGVYRRPGTKKYWLAYVDAGGRLVRESSETTDYREALEKLAKARTDVSKGKRVARGKARTITFAEAAVEYLKWCKPQRAYKNKEYMARSEGELVTRFGGIPLRRFTVALLESYQQTLLAAGKAPATINRKMALVKHLFRKCNDWGWADDDALRTVRKVRMLREPPGRLRYLTPEEVRRLLDECDEGLRGVVTVALCTGMRRGEILNLTWADVDLRNGYLLVADSKNGQRREIPINASVDDVLSGLVRPINDSARVFADVEVRHNFERACKRAGIYNFRFHDLRHAAASFMAMAGVDLMAIKQILGHKTIQMTARYSHLSPGHLRSAVGTIDRAIAISTSQFTSQSGENPLPALPAAPVTS